MLGPLLGSWNIPVVYLGEACSRHRNQPVQGIRREFSVAQIGGNEGWIIDGVRKPIGYERTWNLVGRSQGLVFTLNITGFFGFLKNKVKSSIY